MLGIPPPGYKGTGYPNNYPFGIPTAGPGPFGGTGWGSLNGGIGLQMPPSRGQPQLPGTGLAPQIPPMSRPGGFTNMMGAFYGLPPFIQSMGLNQVPGTAGLDLPRGFSSSFDMNRDFWDWLDRTRSSGRRSRSALPIQTAARSGGLRSSDWLGGRDK
jgi:hypothetical protein